MGMAESTALRRLKQAAYEVQNGPALQKLAAAERLAGELVNFAESIDRRLAELEVKTCR